MTISIPTNTPAFIRQPRVPDYCGWSQSHHRRLVLAGKFPPPITMGEKIVGWPRDQFFAALEKLLSDAASGRRM